MCSTWPWPTQYLHCKVKTDKLEGLKGLKIRVPDRQAGDMVNALGMVGVQIPWGETVPNAAILDALEEILETACLPLESLIAAIRPDAPAPEIDLQRVKHLGAISVLADGKAWPHLPARNELRSWRDGNCEAAFTVRVAGDVCREELATEPRAGV